MSDENNLIYAQIMDHTMSDAVNASDGKGASYNFCPIFNPDLKHNYERWRVKAVRWSKITLVPKSKQGFAAALALQGSADEQATNIPDEDLEKEDGFQTLINKLDEVYMPGKFDRRYWRFKAYHKCSGKQGQKVSEFLPEYHALKCNYDNAGGQIDNETAGYMLLTASNISVEQTQMIRGHVKEDVSYNNMREALKLILGVDNPAETNDNFEENEDSSSTLYSDHKIKGETSQESPRGDESLYNRSRQQSRGSYRGKSMRGRSMQRDRPYLNEKNTEYKRKNMNPQTRNGEFMKCYMCGSRYHFKRKCPELAKIRDDEDKDDRYKNKFNARFHYFMVYLNEQREDNLNALLNECMGSAILDCGCPNTVCGEMWMENYMASLHPDDYKEIVSKPSDQAFTFGDGKSIQACRRVTIPVYWGRYPGYITTDVVKAKIPLLLSTKVMEKAEMVLDFKRTEVKVKVDEGKTTIIRLKKLNSGHYAMPLSL